MKNKFLVVLLAIMIIAFGLLTLTACKKNSEDSHVCTFGEWTIAKEATCTQDGLKERKCTNPDCNKKEQQVIAAGHLKFNEETLYCSACEKYIIKNAEHLKKFRDSVNNGDNYSGKTIELEADIDLNNEEWTPIANVTRKETDDNKLFKGTFDGKNHTISNINCTINVDDACVGLFGVTANAVIKNLNVTGSFTNTIDTVAALIGCDLSKAEEGTSIENCSVNANINGNCVGGILGRAYGVGQMKIEGCTTKGTFSATANGKVGGIVCINNSNKDLTTISNCVNEATISGGNAGTGGIIGFANNNVKIEKCKNTGSIGTSGNTDKYVAGILGYQQGSLNIVISECENSGNIFGINAGGIFGQHGSSQEITITNCINKGNISGIIAGGIASSASGQIENCTNSGVITGGGAESGDGTAGGIIGRVSGSTDITISGCAGGTAEISAKYAGRLIGTVHNGNPAVAHLSIDDNNGDSYENGLGTVGCVGASTALSRMEVTQGTLRGKVASYSQSNCYIIILEQAKWLGYDETNEKTTWHYDRTNDDFVK